MCAVKRMRGQLGETLSPQCIPGIVKAIELNNATLPLHVFDDVMTITSHTHTCTHTYFMEKLKDRVDGVPCVYCT